MSAIEHSDEQLLKDYTRTASPEALARIIERHSNMVYSTCLRILGELSQAEDAAQATFLVLVQKAKRLPESTVLGTWLYYAAQNSARVMRRAGVRRVHHEQKAAQMAKPDTRPAWNQISGELDDALVALPSVQRDAIVLRYFYGLSEQEAAQKLGCPIQTVHTRVSRGVSRLRERFGQGGAILSGTALSAMLLQCSVHAAPSGLASTITSVCIGNSVASGAALATTQGLLKTMAVAKMKTAMLAGLLTVAIAAPTAYLGAQVLTRTPPVVPAAVAPLAAPKLPAPRQPPIPTSISFDFEDGRALPEWIGALVPAPDNPKQRCIRALYDQDAHLSRVKLCNDALGLFSYRAGAVLTFDYWVDEKVEALDMWLWNRTQQKAAGAEAIFDLPRRKWTRATVPLKDLVADKQKLREGDLIVEVVIQTGGVRGGGALYVDNLAVTVSAPDR